MEGLSVAAITYYVVGLISVIARGLASGGIAIKPDVATAISVPIVALIVAFGVRKLRRAFAGWHQGD